MEIGGVRLGTAGPIPAVFGCVYVLPDWNHRCTELFTKNLAVREPVFAGWDNYSQLFSDSLFHKVMINNFWYMLGTVPGALALGLIFALFANRALKFRGFVRVSFFIPMSFR